LFSESELRSFFPDTVVDHLVAHAPPMSDETSAHLNGLAGKDKLHKADLRRFPIGPDLPVLVATRMTLSFPILISAIPLYELDYRQTDAPLVGVLFSDGGITSNFPVHFFDSPLPTRPTFALNLISFAQSETPHPDQPCDDVTDPPRPNEQAYPPVAYIGTMLGFLTAIKDAMQNWRDNAQSQLPGFRDRVIAIKLAKGEGGLNLTMDTKKIANLNDRGTCAGERLLELFAGDGTTKPAQWNDHRFVRYRSTMSNLERFLRSYETAYTTPADHATIPYPERITLGTVPPYPLTKRSLGFAQQTTARYLDLVDTWRRDGNTLDDQGVPRPPSILRAVPPV
jgi:predicted acylesterase/phospholipase RssA